MSADLNRSKNKYHIGEEVFFNLETDDGFCSQFNGKSGTVSEVMALPAGQGFLYVVLARRSTGGRVELLAYEHELRDEPASDAPTLKERLAEFSMEELRGEVSRRTEILRKITGRAS